MTPERDPLDDVAQWAEPGAQQHPAASRNGRFNLEQFIELHLKTHRGPLPWDGDGQKWEVICPFNPEHVGGSAAIIQGANGAIGFKCHHKSCDKKHWQDVRALFDPQSQSVTEGWTPPVPFYQVEPDIIPATCLPTWLADMVQALAENTETPTALGGLLSVAVVAASVAGKAVVSPEPGYVEQLNIYTCPAMESGNRKTAVLNALRQPIVDWEREKIEEVEPVRKRLISQRRTMEARIEKLRKKAAEKDDQTLQRQIEELESHLPIVPPLPRFWVDDCTPERLAGIMDEQNEKIAVFSDEGGIFDIVGGRYSKGVPNLDLWLQGHSGSPVRVDRANPERPPILLDCPLLTVGISPQPDVLAKLCDKPGFRGRGLIARFLYGLPKSPLGHRSLGYRPIPDQIQRRYRENVRRLLALNPESRIVLCLSEPAYTTWKAFQRSVEVELRDGGKLQYLKDWGSKLPGAVSRLAGVFHCVEKMEGIAGDSTIPLSTMNCAIELGSYLISHAQAVFDLMDRDPLVEHAVKLVLWIVREQRHSFTIRDCHRVHQARFKCVDAMIPVLLLLEQHEYIRRLQSQSNGGRKPSDVCEVNPIALKPAGSY
jgi:hypothetical protein